MRCGPARWFFVLALLLAVSVAWNGFACVTTCAADSCMPPCHSHSHASKNCLEQTVTALLIKAPDVSPGLFTAPSPETATTPAPPVAQIDPAVELVSSFAVPAVAVLRI
jgi:hypothetical protein